MSATATATDPNLKHLHTAREQIAKGDLKNAAKTLNKAQKQMPNDARVFMLAGVMAEKSGNPQGALDALRRAVTLAPDWGPGLLELALFYARQNQFEPAIETAEKVARIEPKNLRVLAGVVDIAHRANHLEMAVRHLHRGLELMPGDATLRRALARDLTGLGQYDEALSLWGALIDEDPTDTQALTGRVQTHIAQGNPSRALSDTGALLQLAPGDSVYAYYNALAHGATPAHQPPELNRGMFDDMAEMYDLHMVRGLKYRLPQQIATKITALHPEKKLNILDLGCGTGLLGVFLGRIDGFLIGVDISKKMLEKAARYEVYDRFHNVNLLDALEDTPAALYQVITALDVFIYAGELSGAIPNALRILTPGGHLMFSCEVAPEDGPDLVLQANGRYAHKRSQVLALCQAAGFESVEVEETELRQENQQPVQGFVVTARKSS
ncbi:MAG: tetratricopeptide repeat protein [Burkholderiaceae bacterium]|nr:tetratricopeptide repeat protein [Burkholderiaceae bacterium]